MNELEWDCPVEKFTGSTTKAAKGLFEFLPSMNYFLTYSNDWESLEELRSSDDHPSDGNLFPLVNWFINKVGIPCWLPVKASAVHLPSPLSAMALWIAASTPVPVCVNVKAGRWEGASLPKSSFSSPRISWLSCSSVVKLVLMIRLSKTLLSSNYSQQLVSLSTFNIKTMILYLPLKRRYGYSREGYSHFQPNQAMYFHHCRLHSCPYLVSSSQKSKPIIAQIRINEWVFASIINNSLCDDYFSCILICINVILQEFTVRPAASELDLIGFNFREGLESVVQVNGSSRIVVASVHLSANNVEQCSCHL